MFSHVCFVYPWATLGGVERVLLNRLIAFQRYFPEMVVDIQFLSDAGGLTPLKNAADANGLSVNFIIGPEFDDDADYDLVFCIDCPSFFQQCERRGFRYVAECHTTYDDNRNYIQKLPSKCELLIVPSALFNESLLGDYRDSLSCETFVIPNFVPWDAESEVCNIDLPKWTRQPLVFMGRMDRHKNPVAILEAFALLEEKDPGKFFCLFCGPRSNEVDVLGEAIKLGVEKWLMLLPPIPFTATGTLLKSLMENRAIFVSPSKAESFGLAAAEALASGMPVVLSDIPSHRFLLGDASPISTYELNDKFSMCEAVERVANRYDELSNVANLLREKISAASFVKDWQALYARISS